METRFVPVAPGIELAVDRWAPNSNPNPNPGARAADGAPAFVLVHGLASNARLWDGVAARLADRGFEAYTVDQRGHGRSSKPDGPYDVPTVAADLAALIGALSLAQPVVAGQSWGGNVVLELGAQHPGLTRGIACVDGGWFEPGTAFPSWEACLARLAPPRLLGRPFAEMQGWIARAHPDWPETGVRGTLANFEVRADGTIAPWLTYERHIEVLRGMWEHRPTALYPRVWDPVLLVPATGPDRTPGSAPLAALGALPKARIHPIAGDHDIHAQHPGEVADVLISMLTDGGAA